MQMRPVGISRIAEQAQHLTLLNLVSRFNTHRTLLHVSEHAELSIAVIYHDDVPGNSPHRLRHLEENICLNDTGARIVLYVVTRIDDCAIRRSDNLSSPGVEVFIRLAIRLDDLKMRAEREYVIGILLTPLALMLLIEIMSSGDDECSFERKDQLRLLSIICDRNLQRLTHRFILACGQLKMINELIYVERDRL